MAKLVWRVKVVADLGLGAVSETEVARIERADFAVPETVGLSLDEGKELTAAIQAEIVRSQAAEMGERFRWCEHCGAKLWSKGYYPSRINRDAMPTLWRGEARLSSERSPRGLPGGCAALQVPR